MTSHVDFGHENIFFPLGTSLPCTLLKSSGQYQFSPRGLLIFSVSLPDVVFHPWKKEETGNQSRVILYTITLTNPLAPKTATVTETQVRGGSAAWLSLPRGLPALGQVWGEASCGRLLCWPTCRFSLQTMYKASQESECYVIDAEVLTHDVPYHDYFYTINRYTLTRVARNKCRLR